MAANDIYNRTSSKLKGTFTADRARLVLTGNLGVLTQSLQVQYRQNITRLYELASTDMYFIGGRTAGDAAFGRVIGPSSTMTQIFQVYGDVCKATNPITFDMSETNCLSGESGSNRYVMQNCVINSYGLSLGNPEQMIINDQTSMMFTSLEVAK
jgi:hypothetical protein